MPRRYARPEQRFRGLRSGLARAGQGKLPRLFRIRRPEDRARLAPDEPESRLLVDRAGGVEPGVGPEDDPEVAMAAARTRRTPRRDAGRCRGPGPTARREAGGAWRCARTCARGAPNPRCPRRSRRSSSVRAPDRGPRDSPRSPAPRPLRTFHPSRTRRRRGPRGGARSSRGRRPAARAERGTPGTTPVAGREQPLDGLHRFDEPPPIRGAERDEHGRDVLGRAAVVGGEGLPALFRQRQPLAAGILGGRSPRRADREAAKLRRIRLRYPASRPRSEASSPAVVPRGAQARRERASRSARTGFREAPR